jgi:hypothetical protein
VRYSSAPHTWFARLCATILLAGSVVAVPAPSAQAEGAGVASPSSLNALFNSYGNNANCATWSGGDSTASVELSDGKVVWFFSDTYLNAPSERMNGGWFKSFINNSMVVQSANGNLAKTITGGDTCREHSLVYARTPVTNDDCLPRSHPLCRGESWYWNADVGLSANEDDVVAFYYRVRRGTDEPFEVVNSAIVKIPESEFGLNSNNVLENEELHPIDCPAANGEQVVWGADIMSWPQLGSRGQTYDVWGWGVDTHKLYHAYVPAGGELGNITTWRYSIGTEKYSSSCGQARASSLTVGSSFSVEQTADGWWLFQRSTNFNSNKIVAFPSEDPWTFPYVSTNVYSIPELPHVAPTWHMAYDLRDHSRGGSASETFLSYNVNTTAVNIGCGSLNNWNASIYRPRFLILPTPASPFASSGAAPALRVDTPATDAQAAGAVEDLMAAHGIRDISPPAAAPPQQQSQGAVLPTNATGTPLGGSVDQRATAAADTNWYDSWSSALQGHGRCPFLENYSAAPLSGTVMPDGSVNLVWNDIGPDVWYWIYERNVSEEAGYRRYELWSQVPRLTVMPITSASKQGDTFSWYIVPFASGSPDANGDRVPDIEGGASNKVQGPVRMQRPAAPTGVVAGGTDFGAVTLGWNGVVFPSSQVFYWIYYWTGSAAPTRVGPWSAGQRSAIVAPLQPGLVYNFYVTAENLAGEGAASNVASARVP